jgi:Zn-dependent membrane protease YugP
MPLVIIGLLLSAGEGSMGMMMVDIGILLFTAVVIFQIITLPVEFDASARALELLEEHRFLTPEEIQPAKKVLSAASLTYVAAALTAIASLLRLMLIANRRR